MLHILSITVPIYLLIALGFLAGRRGWFDKAEMRVLGRFVIQLALPALMFQALSSRRVGEILNGSFLLAYALGSLAVMLAAFTWARRVKRRDITFSAYFGLGMSASNSGFVGYPIVVQFLGPVAAVAMALTMLVENLLMIPVALALADGGNSSKVWHATLARTLRRLAGNPLILSISAGLAMSVLGLQLPAPVARAVQLLANASAPVALFVIGGSLVGLQLHGKLRSVAAIALGKLILHPLAVLALLMLVPLEGPLRAAAPAFAAMPMLSIFPILAQAHGEENFAAAALLLTMLLSFLTISVWLWLLKAGLGWV
ncbi:AEC family transporter [Azohydromonas caseinilytica]|uniref:AEC family transporter n=1 Tax=Azohydromonas caseinilytica TaxID=2728836 RepID=A0A848FAD4_9BURK|nr:AEC family transporter [Azohydromonas caseinilytica]NML15705.1 AEC family transporter [Azohydromonas caseinilytica]